MGESERRMHRRQLSADWARQFEARDRRRSGRWLQRAKALLARLLDADDRQALRVAAFGVFVADVVLAWLVAVLCARLAHSSLAVRLRTLAHLQQPLLASARSRCLLLRRSLR